MEENQKGPCPTCGHDMHEVISYHEYKGREGHRIFKVSSIGRAVTQVVLDTGDVKKGRTRNIGIYQISHVSYLTQYYGKYSKERNKQVDRSVWDNAVEEVIKKLK